MDGIIQTRTRTAAPRRLAAVLFADIVGFTTITAEDDARAFELARLLQDTARRCVGRRGGRVVRFVGDAVLAEFPSAEAAVRAALELARDFETVSANEGRAPGTLHMGVHVGELTEAPDGDIYGASVNVAARLQADAAPRQLLVSDDVARQLRGRRDFIFEHAGTRSLKGVAEAVTVHVVRAGTDAGADDVAWATTSYLTLHAEPPRRAELAPTRLIVLPFRLLRPDGEIEFLSFGLADAITATLSGLHSLVVRSSLAALRYADMPDLEAIGRDAAVDLVLTGTLLRAGDRVRVTAQLTEVASGTVLWSESQQVPLGDLFQLQDELTQRVVQSVQTPLTSRERRMIRRDVPASAGAYELYLRAVQAGTQRREWTVARDLYLEALREDPHYAPAWAQLGRCRRLIGKYTPDPAAAAQEIARAEEAFQRALELNPDLPMAHGLYAQLEVERGRPREAMLRLLERGRLAARDAHIFAGLVHAFRYCGLLEESVAADRAARRLDPTITTSVEYTWIMLRRYEESLQAAQLTRGDVRDVALTALGRADEARAWLHLQLERTNEPIYAHFGPFFAAVLRGLGGRFTAEDAALVRRMMTAFTDSEGRFLAARWLGRFGAVEDAIALLDLAVDGFFCSATLREDAGFDPLRSHPAFAGILERATAGFERARSAYLAADGPELLEAGSAA